VKRSPLLGASVKASHAQYLREVNAPETKEAFGEIALFFDKHVGK
jgi:monoterpene epsilon-lactone hydrolase